jgi:predicted nucleic acid-binding Zn ribbon protein
MTTWRTAGLSAADRDPRPVADSLDRVTRALGAPRAQLLATVFSEWERLVGPDIAAHAQPRSLRDGVLVIAVEQPAWATQLRFMSAALLARVQAETDREGVSEIQIRVGAPTGPDMSDQDGRTGWRGRSRNRHRGPLKSPPSGRL